jgi:hypothetical protein
LSELSSVWDDLESRSGGSPIASGLVGSVLDVPDLDQLCERFGSPGADQEDWGLRFKKPPVVLKPLRPDVSSAPAPSQLGAIGASEPTLGLAPSQLMTAEASEPTLALSQPKTAEASEPASEQREPSQPKAAEASEPASEQREPSRPKAAEASEPANEQREPSQPKAAEASEPVSEQREPSQPKAAEASEPANEQREPSQPKAAEASDQRSIYLQALQGGALRTGPNGTSRGATL